jgi:anthranilate synthase/aminodeoxychorismate synthase-like glutamine amidotransferase
VIVVIDNYDSFTYNLVQRMGELGWGEALRVIRNDRMPPEAVEAECAPTHLIISPGPGTPDDAGLSCDFVRHFHGRIPILGVCLGHQCIGQVFGGDVVRADRLMHGKTSQVEHDGKGVFAGLANPFEATRYHSLIVREETLPECLAPTAHTPEGELMGLRHRDLAVEGVQFHPESFLTVEGPKLLRNFLAM